MQQDGFPNPPFPLNGYVLAGGKSSRMGVDKATLKLQGTPLVQLAVQKLLLFCPHVAILGTRLDLAPYAEIIPDSIPNAGPLAGIEAALRHTSHPWLFLLPVDVPLLPASFLAAWALNIVMDPHAPLAHFFEVDGQVQPLVAILHRSLGPFVSTSLERGERKVLSTLEAAASQAAAVAHRPPGIRLHLLDDAAWEPPPAFALKEKIDRHRWFANANAPEEFASIERILTAPPGTK